jgi:DNA ligase-associated metallophosphoesterase
MEITFGGERLILLADRALYWPAFRTLVLADVHLGKDASFRAAGLPVPVGNSVKDLARIERLLVATAAQRLTILGDLVHNRKAHQAELMQAFTQWRCTHKRLEVILIRGNHDRHAGPCPEEWAVNQVTEPFDAGPLSLAHFPRNSEKPLLCGHVHPTVAVRDFDRTFASIPCFVADPNQLILPAFGSFTGGHTATASPGRAIYISTGKSVATASKW